MFQTVHEVLRIYFFKERNELTIIMFIHFSFYYFLLETKF